MIYTSRRSRGRPGSTAALPDGDRHTTHTTHTGSVIRGYPDNRRAVVRFAALGATILAFIAATILLFTNVASATEQLPDELEDVTVTEHLGDTVSLDLPFVNQDGRRVTLSDYMTDGEPVLLTLNYYECPSLCTLQLNGLAEGLSSLDLPGADFRIVTVSIDPGERPELAGRKQAAYLNFVQRDDIRWDFLTGDERHIRQLADEVGFGYRYIEDRDIYAHAPVAFFLSPEGKLTRYLYGIQYTAQDLKFALIDASEGTVGSTIDRILLSCFHFIDGDYAPYAMGFMRLGGLVVATALALFLAVFWRREFRRRRTEATA